MDEMDGIDAMDEMDGMDEWIIDRAINKSH